MSDGSDRLHFYGIHLLQRMVEDTWCINCLKPEVLIIKMAYEKTFCSEGIRLYVNICSCDISEEAAFSYIRVSTN